VKIFACFLLLGSLLLSSCSSVVSSVEPGRSLGSYQRYFVKTNLNDNRGISIRIVRALEARGLQAERGPLTMLPRSAQAIISYDDRWNWDFRYHLTYLNLSVQDPRSERTIADSTFQGPSALLAQPDAVIEEVLTKLLGPAPRKPAP
jgi:uncharacterized protein YceK